MSDSGNYEVVVIRSKNDVKVLMSGLSKKEAEKVKEEWETLVFNAEVFFDPVPKLKVKQSSNE